MASTKSTWMLILLACFIQEGMQRSKARIPVLLVIEPSAIISFYVRRCKRVFFFFMNCRCLFVERPGDDISGPRYISSNLFIYGFVKNFNANFTFSVSEYFCDNLKFSFLMDKNGTFVDEHWAYVIVLEFEMGVLGN